MTQIETKYAEILSDGMFNIGQPIIDESICPDGKGHFRHYDNASIYWSGESGRPAYLIYGLIRGKWAAMSWEKSPLGYPVTDESNTGNGGGRYNSFQNNGAIYWKSGSNEAFAVYGHIFDKYAEQGWEAGALGFPTSDVKEITGNHEQFVTFENGRIWWTLKYATHIVLNNQICVTNDTAFDATFRFFILFCLPIFYTKTTFGRIELSVSS